jgi:hypothetical protein
MDIYGLSGNLPDPSEEDGSKVDCFLTHTSWDSILAVFAILFSFISLHL